METGRAGVQEGRQAGRQEAGSNVAAPHLCSVRRGSVRGTVSEHREARLNRVNCGRVFAVRSQSPTFHRSSVYTAGESRERGAAKGECGGLREREPIISHPCRRPVMPFALMSYRGNWHSESLRMRHHKTRAGIKPKQEGLCRYTQFK